jgi:uncharacterized membrane protein
MITPISKPHEGGQVLKKRKHQRIHTSYCQQKYSINNAPRTDNTYVTGSGWQAMAVTGETFDTYAATGSGATSAAGREIDALIKMNVGGLTGGISGVRYSIMKTGATAAQEATDPSPSSEKGSVPPRPKQRQKLGLLRLWEVVFAVMVLSYAVVLMFLSKRMISFDFNIYLSLLDAVVAGVLFWLIVQRKRVVRPIVCGYTLVMLVVGITGDIVIDDSFSWSYVTHYGRSVFVFASIYFLFSKRARTLLTEPFNINGGKTHAASDGVLYRPRTGAFWRDLAMFFMVFSVVGHWMERIFETIMRYAAGIYDPTAPLWQSYLAPFTIYGFGAVLCILLLFPLKQFLARKLKNIWLVALVVYLANTIVCTAIELAVGLLTNHPDASGHLIYWDYSNLPFNFMGQICLQNALAFGLVATLMVWVIFPTIEGYLNSLSNDTVNIVAVLITIIYCFLVAFYLITLPSGAFG